MFRHKGKARKLKHNLKIASLLSFVAGIVNVAGFLSVQRLTTNVTGHFAFFVDEIFKLNFISGLIFLLYIIFFFLGSFFSNLLVEIISRKSERFVFTAPIAIESIILISVAFFGQNYILQYPNVIACSLLFAMGLQNSLVTKISNAIVRTTHLTGLFTDLGIELSQLFFYNTKEEKEKLFSSINLRMRIISFFFIGGVTGGMFYLKFGLYVLLIGAVALIVGLIYDSVKVKIILLKKNYRVRGLIFYRKEELFSVRIKKNGCCVLAIPALCKVAFVCLANGLQCGVCC